MALETLVGVEEIDGFEVAHITDSPESDTSETCLKRFIRVHHRFNAITFQIQNGPIKENGVNGCQVVTMIQAAKLIIEKLNEKCPCIYNSYTIARLNEAIEWQEMRTKDREKRNVEGTNHP